MVTCSDHRSAVQCCASQREALIQNDSLGKKKRKKNKYIRDANVGMSCISIWKSPPWTSSLPFPMSGQYWLQHHYQSLFFCERPGCWASRQPCRSFLLFLLQGMWVDHCLCVEQCLSCMRSSVILTWRWAIVESAISHITAWALHHSQLMVQVLQRLFWVDSTFLLLKKNTVNIKTFVITYLFYGEMGYSTREKVHF